MRPFLIYLSCKESIAAHQEKLVALISELVQPDIIYLLGASLHRRRSESIFCPQAPTSQHTTCYYLLILLPDFNNKEQYQWQDEVEQHCYSVVPITTIILKTSTFIEWLSAGHPFALMVQHSAISIYHHGDVDLPRAETAGIRDFKIVEKCYKEGLNKATEFFAGAALFQVRKQYSLAAFMLHQAMEQGLRTMLTVGTGYYSCTHNLDRLIRYASMVCYQLPDIFPRRSEKDKQLFRLLQKAYSESRYGQDYAIHLQDLLILTEKVNDTLQVLIDFEKVFQSLPTSQQ